MTYYAESFGWFLFLSCAVFLSYKLSEALLKLIWDESAKGKVVDATDALFAIVSIVFSWIKLAKSNWLATVCAVAVFILLSGSTGVSVYAAFGYSATAFAVAGVFTPMLLRRLRFRAKTSGLQAPAPDESVDS